MNFHSMPVASIVTSTSSTINPKLKLLAGNAHFEAIIAGP
jgi:hypothetical protein